MLDGLMVISGFARLSESAGTIAATAVGQAANGATTRDNGATPPVIEVDSIRDGVEDVDRNDRIRAMYRDVKSTREVGEVFGLHYSTIARIVADGDTQRDNRDMHPAEQSSAATATTSDGPDATVRQLTRRNGVALHDQADPSIGRGFVGELTEKEEKQ